MGKVHSKYYNSHMKEILRPIDIVYFTHQYFLNELLITKQWGPIWFCYTVTVNPTWTSERPCEFPATACFTRGLAKLPCLFDRLFSRVKICKFQHMLLEFIIKELGESPTTNLGFIIEQIPTINTNINGLHHQFFDLLFPGHVAWNQYLWLWA